MIRPEAAAGGASLTLRYLVVAATAFVLAALALPWLAPELTGHYYHPWLLALTHTVTLGWITLAIMGASYQLIPILLQRPLASEWLVRWQLPVMTVGVAGVVGHFAMAAWRGFAWSAGLVALAALAHAVHAGLSVARATSSFTARMFSVGLVGLTLTALFGMALGVHKVHAFLPLALFPALHAHVQLALLGWVLPIVLGVAARVYPMFLLAPEPAPAMTWTQFLGASLGAPAVVAGVLLQAHPLLVLGSLAVAAAVGAHLASVLVMMRDRKRPRLDWGLRFVLAGTAVLAPATVLGLALATDAMSGSRPALVYGVLALGGWASLTIVGMMLKIVPFLVWYRAYASRVGQAPVPTLAHMSWPRAEAAAFAGLVAGVSLLAAGVATGEVIVIRTAGLLVALGALAFAATLVRVLRHLAARPQPAATSTVSVAS